MANTTQTQTTTTSTPLPALPAVFEGDGLYDHIMAEIEPELISTVYETLDEKYKNETPEQKAERQARYDKAFTEYERRFALYTNEWNGRLRAFQTNVIRSMEEDARNDDSTIMSQLESAFA